MKYLTSFILLCIILLSAVIPLPSQAQSPIKVSQDQVVSEFPIQLIFKLFASSSEKIEEVKLLYHTNGATCQPSIAQQVPEFEPATTVDIEWKWDFTRSGVLPPGAEVYWQWQVTDAGGNSLLTDEQSYLVVDPRNDWNTLKSGQVILQWYQGSASFGQALLSIATRSLDRLANHAGVHPNGQIWLSIYPGTEELLEVDIYASEWAGGLAYPEYNSSIMAIAPTELDWASSVIPHELAHLVTDAMTFNCKGLWLPTWLSEGLSVYSEGEISKDYVDLVSTALDKNTLPPLRTLVSGFSSNSSKAVLSYAQSGMVVTHMIDKYGAQKMTDLLASIQSGNKIDRALLAVYGKDTDGIDAEWRISMGYAAQPTLAPTSASRTSVPTLSLWTSAVKPTSTATPVPTLTATTIPPTETPIPAASSTLADPSPTPGITQPDPPASTGVKAAYIAGFAFVAVLLTAAIIIILAVINRRKGTNP